MTEVASLNVKITFDTSAITGGVSKATAGLEQISNKTKTVSAGFTKFKEIALGVFGGNLITAGAMEATKVLTEMRNEMIQTQAAQQRLESAMGNMKNVTKEQTTEVSKNAEAYSKLGFAQSDALTGMGTLVTATNNVGQATKLMAMAADYARYRHITLADSARILARGTQGSARAFKEMGITLDTTIPKNQAIAKAFDQLNAKIGGQAQAYTKTFAGQMAVLKEKFQGVADAIAKYLLPVFSKLFSFISYGINWIEKNSSALKVFAGLILVVTANIWGMAIAGAALDIVASPIFLITTGIIALAAAFVYAWNHFKIFRDAVAEGLATIIQIVGYLVGAVARLIRGMSYLPGMKFLRGIADGFDKVAESIGKAAKATNDLKNSKMSVPDGKPKIPGIVTPGGKTGITGNVPVEMQQKVAVAHRELFKTLLSTHLIQMILNVRWLNRLKLAHRLGANNDVK
jgi:hypothetical protein